MTNTPGDQPTRPEPEGEPTGEQARRASGGPSPGSWEQQAGRQQPPYGPGPMGYPAPMPYAPDHPRATTSLVLGILGVVLCQVVAPFAWAMGKRTLDEIDASRGMVGGRGAAQAGYILGIVGTVLLGLSLVFVAIYVILMIAVVGGGLAVR